MKSKPDSTRIWKARKEDLSKMVQRLASKAEIDAHGDKIRWHGLRAYLFNSLCRVVSTEKAKQVVGKQLSESAYLNEKDLLEDYAKVMPLTAYDTNHVKEKVNELSQSLTEKDALIKQQQIEINALKLKLSENNNTMNKMDARLTTLEEIERKKPEKKTVWD
jgi:uncharacterized coiled-coil protein SlyX